jgi:nucleoside-diphosphate-sugar epimerase
MNILITGGFGNMGLSCAAALLKPGYHVRILDLPTPRNKNTAKTLSQVEAFWGDVRDLQQVNGAVQNQDVIIHLAAVIPPASNEHPQMAEAVNVGGTRNLIAAAQAQPRPPRLLFSSTFDLYGPTQHLAPPRRVGDPLQATDAYSQHKLTCEEMLQGSGLTWAIFRLSDVPVIALRDPHPIMFEIPLDTRFETMHTLDAGLALARAAVSDLVWGRILNVGGGPGCQITYRDFLWGMLNSMGIGELPESAFTTTPYCTDWLDTAESQQMFNYQNHTFTDILTEVSALLGWRRLFVPLARPFVRRSILKLSPYWKPGAR